MSMRNENSPKAGSKQSLVGLAKSVLVEQHQRLNYKNNIELEILEDLYKFMKSRCHIETQYNQAMVKLANQYLQRKQVSLKTDPKSEEKALFPAWRGYLGQMERNSKERLNHFEQMTHKIDQLKQMKTHKHHVVKKTMDTYFKKAQDDVIASLSEIDKCRKLYFDEEHYANQARDKEEKIKKRKLGILSKFTDMQSKKEKSSAQKEASEIQSTQARNEYILALAAGNAHLQHYFNTELSYLLDILEDNTIDNCKEILIQLIDKEEKCTFNSASALKECLEYLHKVTATYTHLAFLTDGSNTSLSERLQIDFEPCENDTVTDVSIEHNAGYALEHEVTKWTTCFSKETRNLVKIEQQLTKCYKLQSTGKKTVEVNGIGQMDLEQRIEDLKLQKRKCDLNKCKAKARLLALKKGGLNVDDLDAIEMQITQELEEQLEKQQREKQMLGVNTGDVDALSRTPSLRSTNVSPDLGRISVMSENKSQSEDRQEYNETPEPISSENDLSEMNDQAQYQQQKQQYQPTWNEYDANAVWSQSETSTNEQPKYDEYANQDHDLSNQQDLVNQYVQALYPYSAQNEDELDIVEYEHLLVISADEKDWIKVQNSNGKIGYVPFAYVELVGNQQAQQSMDALHQNESNMQAMDSSQYSDSIIQSSPVNQLYSEETSYTINQQQQYAYQDQTMTQESYQEKKTYTARDHAMDQQSVTKTDANYAIAAYDYEATNDEEISFKEGDQIVILEKSEDGWWVGKNKEGQTGHFPSMLVHCDEAEEEESSEENDESTTELNFEPPPVPPPVPPVLSYQSSGETEREDQEIDEEDENETKNKKAPQIKPPSFLAPTPDTGIVITEPTPEIENKPIVDESNSDNKEKENVEKIKKENNNEPIKQNYVPSQVEINIIESEKQVFSSDEEDEQPSKEEKKDFNKEENEKQLENQETELPSCQKNTFLKNQDLQDDNVKVQVELNDLPPPPPELTQAFSPEEDEDEQLIIKRLKQLKDTNNNFTASFDILDDSELTTAENSQSDENKPEEKLGESKESTSKQTELNKDKNLNEKENEKCDNQPKNSEDSNDFEANFEANFPMDED